MVPNQDLDSFFEVLKDKALQSWLREEIVCGHRIGITRLNDRSYKDLNNALNSKDQRKGQSKLQGVENYDILSNPFNEHRYLYVPCIFPKRQNFAISQFIDNSNLRKANLDLVRIVCDLPYMEE